MFMEVNENFFKPSEINTRVEASPKMVSFSFISKMAMRRGSF